MKKKGFISMSLVYTFLILFLLVLLAVLASYNNKNKYLQAISDKIKEDIKLNLQKNNPGDDTNPEKYLYNVVLANNQAQSDENIDFTMASSDTNGKGLYFAEETNNGKKVYYYRGDITNNFVIFANYCWRIVRTNEDESIKIIYYGNPSNNQCLVSSLGIKIVNSYVDSSLTTEEKLQYSNSTVKQEIDLWYQNNIMPKGNDITQKIKDSYFCNDTSNPTVSGNSTYYGAGVRLKLASTIKPTFKCTQEEDKYSVSSGKLTYPVAILTADEAIYSGLIYSTSVMPNNNTSYLKDYVMYTMSPAYTINSTHRQALLAGSRVSFTALIDFRIYPVISLKYETEVASGTGTSTDPYIIE